MLTYFQAIIIGLLQGVTELFPISSLGHSVLVPWLFNWKILTSDQSKSESFYLAFVVILHVATAVALLIFYRKTWYRIIGGLFGSVKTRKLDNPDAKLGWLLITSAIPAGIIGLIFEHQLRTQFAKPLSAIIFLFINGFILLFASRLQSTEQIKRRRRTAGSSTIETVDQISDKVTFGRAALIGFSQVGAFFAGISRSGITITGGMLSGLSNEDAARFSFLMATPIILAAGVVKLPDFFSSLSDGVRGQIVVGGLVAGVAAYLTVRYLDTYFQSKSLRPFGLYCIGAAILFFAVGLLRGHF